MKRLAHDFRLPCVLALIAFLYAPAPAHTQDTLRVYNWSGYIAQNTIPEFEARTQIDVAYRTYDTLEELDAVLARERTGYDVIILPAHKAERFLETRGARSLGVSFLARHADTLDADLMARLARFDPDNVHLIPYAASMMGFAYNEEEMAQRLANAPNTQGEFFFDPEIVSVFSSCGVGALNTPMEVWTLAQSFARGYGTARPDDIDALLGALWPFVRAVAPSEDNVASLQAGSLCLAMASAADVFRAQMNSESDIKIRWATGKKSGILLLDVILVPEGARANFARRFIEYLLKPQVAAQLTLETGWASAVSDARAFLPDSFAQSRLVYPRRRKRAGLILQPALRKGDAAVRQRIWARFKHAVDTNAAQQEGAQGASSNLPTVAENP